MSCIDPLVHKLQRRQTFRRELSQTIGLWWKEKGEGKRGQVCSVEKRCLRVIASVIGVRSRSYEYDHKESAAGVALCSLVGQLAFRDYAHKYSPKKFTQPQLFACLVLKEFLRFDYGIWRRSCATAGTLRP